MREHVIGTTSRTETSLSQNSKPSENHRKSQIIPAVPAAAESFSTLYQEVSICLPDPNLCNNTFNRLWGKKATETVMQLCKCIMQKRIQLSRCHTRQTYYRILAKDAQDTSGLRPKFCWQQRRVLLPAVRSSSSQISGKRNKPTLNDGVTVTRVL